jgi:cytoskeletal protein RodZ
VAFDDASFPDPTHGAREGRSPAEIARAKAIVAGRLEARARRASRIRRMIATGTVCLFAATWLIIFGVLAAGHDPALSRSTRLAAASAAQTGSSTQQPDTSTQQSDPSTQQPDTSAQQFDGSTPSQPSAPSQPAQPAPVTTQQS